MERHVPPKAATGAKEKWLERRSTASRKQLSVQGKKSPRVAKASKKVTFGRYKHPSGDHGSKGSTNVGMASPSARGLRQMSIKICVKVMEVGKMSCNEVADEIIKSIRMDDDGVGGGKLCGDKNIRRRLYDALNVLDAVNVIAKDSKDITWRGMPSSDYQQSQRLVSERIIRKNEIKKKQEAMREQVIQQVAYRNLVNYNQKRDQAPIIWSAIKIPIPFIIFNAHPSTHVRCDATRDFADVMLFADAPFALNDENAILSQLGFDRTSLEDLQLLFPEEMLSYCLTHNLLHGVLCLKRVASDFRSAESEPKAKRFRRAETC